MSDIQWLHKLRAVASCSMPTSVLIVDYHYYSISKFRKPNPKHKQTKSNKPNSTLIS